MQIAVNQKCRLLNFCYDIVTLIKILVFEERKRLFVSHNCNKIVLVMCRG